MKRVLCVALAIVGALTDQGAVATPIIKRGPIGNVPPSSLPCVVRVDFTSTANGPDYDTFNAMRAYLADTKDVYQAEAFTWGREGEFSLCLQIDEPSRTDRVVADLSALIAPPAATTGGPTVVVKGSGGK